MKKLDVNKILKVLDKRGYIEFCPICRGCTLEIIELVFDHMPSVNFNITQVEDETFMLKINV